MLIITTAEIDKQNREMNVHIFDFVLWEWKYVSFDDSTTNM